jgi:ribose transport system substrate-binding protein
MLTDGQLNGAAVTNPAVIGGVGAAIAIDALTGKNPQHMTMLTPQLWDKSNKSSWQKYYNPKLPPTYSTFTEVKPYTTFTPDQLSQCKGP